MSPYVALSATEMPLAKGIPDLTQPSGCSNAPPGVPGVNIVSMAPFEWQTTLSSVIEATWYTKTNIFMIWPF